MLLPCRRVIAERRHSTDRLSVDVDRKTINSEPPGWRARYHNTNYRPPALHTGAGRSSPRLFVTLQRRSIFVNHLKVLAVLETNQLLSGDPKELDCGQIAVEDLIVFAKHHESRADGINEIILG